MSRKRESLIMKSLASAYPAEQQRLRDLLAWYRAQGEAGMFGAMNLENLLRKADRAAVSGDVIEMLEVFVEMERWS